MKRWQQPHLKWLRPGMGVKRWLLLLVGGLFLIGLAVVSLAELVDFSTWWRFFQRFRPEVLSPTLQVGLFLLAGGLMVALAVFSLSRSLLSAFRRTDQNDVVEVVYRHRQRRRGPKVVAVGGGHGLNTLLRGLKEHTDNITAIVTVADDGGSSGRLRRELGMLPPGDFRNCLAALSDAEGLVSQLFQYRFGSDTIDLDGHSFGNLYLSAMTAITGSFVAALEESSRVLAVRGRVIPSTLAQVTLCGEVLLAEPRPEVGVHAGLRSGQEGTASRLSQVRGESRIGGAGGRIQRVYLEPENPPVYPEAIQAILDADLIVIGPGSLYTSVLPNLLVPDLARAIATAQATKVYVCNVATQAGETEGFDVSAHVDALRSHVGPDMFHSVLANHTFSGSPPPGEGVDWVHLPEVKAVHYVLVTRDLVDGQYPWRHDPEKLAGALMELLAV
jgi:uncharacterized cofD-like protein